MIIIGILFFIFGFVTWLNGSLIPFLKLILDLSDFQALFVTFAFYIAYTVMALPMSYILNQIGYKKGMMTGLGIMAVGALLFIPAALSATYAIFLIALFTLGGGLTILQTASNPYVIALGDKESAAKRISIMGIINKTAGVIVPLVFTAIIFSDLDTFSTTTLSHLQKEELASRLITPYITMAITLIGLIALINFSNLKEIEFENNEKIVDKTNILSYPQVVLGSIALFFYVGIEVIAGDTIGLYGSSLGLDNYTSFTSYTMIFMVIGYAIGIFTIPKYISQENALKLSSIFGMVFLLGVLMSDGWLSLFFVALLGLANALVWPTIWPLALDGLGRHTPQGSALLIMGIAGGAILPLVFGVISDSLNIQNAYIIGFVCYGFILYYAVSGHKKKRW
jgi:glucose/galactose transporter